ncbi:MAG: hypothetical protein PHG05_01650 [Candidatus Nanoarchaeia archaeon]|nr:hypothetical protein [Candidatus Nanoarchaeia archaeon]
MARLSELLTKEQVKKIKNRYDFAEEVAEARISFESKTSALMEELMRLGARDLDAFHYGGRTVAGWRDQISDLNNELITLYERLERERNRHVIKSLNDSIKESQNRIKVYQGDIVKALAIGFHSLSAGDVREESERERRIKPYRQNIEDIVKYAETKREFGERKLFKHYATSKRTKELMSGGMSYDDAVKTLKEEIDQDTEGKYKGKGFWYYVKTAEEFIKGARHPIRNIKGRAREKGYLRTRPQHVDIESEKEAYNAFKEGGVSERVLKYQKDIIELESLRKGLAHKHRAGNSSSDYHNLNEGLGKTLNYVGKEQKKELDEYLKKKRHSLEEKVAAAALFWIAGIIALARAKGTSITGGFAISNQYYVNPNNILFVVGFLCLIIGTAVYLHHKKE